MSEPETITSLPVSGFLPLGDVTVRRAPYNGAMLIHRKAGLGRKTVCGLALPDERGEWVVVGVFSALAIAHPDNTCEDCLK